MQLTIKPTEHFFMAGDVMVRMWRGTARHPDGAEEPCIALVAVVALTGDAQTIAAGLVSIPPPDGEQARDWARDVLSRSYEEDP